MKINIYFNDNYGRDRFVDTCNNSNEIIPKIKKFVKELNKNYKIYYIRSWEEEGKTWYDVGSHSEFFFTEKVDE